MSLGANPLLTLLTLVTLAAAVTAAVIDARSGRIPNWLTLPLLGVGVGLQWAARGKLGLVLALSGLVLCGLLPWLMYRATQGRAIGGGDVKLLAALGAAAGPMLGLEIQLSAFVLLGVFALVVLAFRGQLWRVLANALALLLRPLLPAKWRPALSASALTEMRMGPAIAVAVGAALLRDELGARLPWLG